MGRIQLVAKISGAALLALILAVLTGHLSTNYGYGFIEVVVAVFVFTNVIIGLSQLFIDWSQLTLTGTDTDDDTGNRDEDADTTTDSPGPDVEPQSKAYSLDETTDNTNE